MNGMRERSIQCVNPKGVHRMAYTAWGDPENRNVLFCVHGLTRNSRDFDDLAQALCDRYQVICPDVAGRGRSDWLPDSAFYTIPQYAADMMTLMATLAPKTLHWVGTSMGGLIGMAIAGQPASPISKLVLNDVGPVLTLASLKRIGQYLGNAPRFESYAQAEAYIRAVSVGFGPLDDRQWQHLTTHVIRRAADGRYEFLYDPGIAKVYEQVVASGNGGDIEFWPYYDAITCPTLVLRGAESDLLDRSTAIAMTERGPRARLVEFPGIGHAPTLMTAAQIEVVRNFLVDA